MTEPGSASGGRSQQNAHEQRLQRARKVLDEATRLAEAGASPAEGAGAGAATSEAAGPGQRRRDARGRRSAGGEVSAAASAARDTEPDAEERARTVALNMLNHSARSRAELAQAMARKDVPDAVAERVLDRFEDVGLIDDAEYAAMLVRTRQSERGLARRALAEELKRKGIVGEVATEALDAVEPDDEAAAARRVVEKRLRSMVSLKPEVKRRRLLATLARKGHPAGLSYRVVDEALHSDEA